MQKRQIHPTWIFLRWAVTIVAVVFMLVGWHLGLGGDDTPGPGFNWLLGGGILLIGYWTAIVSHWVVERFIWPTVEVAITPVLSPVEIELQLRREGHNPTIQDVAAVHQMLTARRNEAAVGVGVTVGALYLLHQHG